MDVNDANCATGTGGPTDPFCNIVDALNVAAARAAAVDAFLTNDHRLRRVATPAVLIVDDYA